MPNIVVIGSINVDLVMYVEHLPQAGENRVASSFLTNLGGKGANQAVAAARCGANVHLIGCVGDDLYGKMAIEHFKSNKVDTSGVFLDRNESTGTAMINVADRENSLSVYLGANKQLDVSKVEANLDLIRKAEIVLVQNEIPAETIEYVLTYCHSAKIKTILNPAPDARLTTQKWLELAGCITPNIHEFRIIFGNVPLEEAVRQYPEKLVVTLGAKGCAFYDTAFHQIPPMQVNTIDPTGAGDTFNGVLAFAQCRNLSFADSVRMANIASSLSTAKKGCQDAMPYLKDIEKYLTA